MPFTQRLIKRYRKDSKERLVTKLSSLGTRYEGRAHRTLVRRYGSRQNKQTMDFL